jgi:hypothetical protein
MNSLPSDVLATFQSLGRPSSKTTMEFMIHETQSDQSTYIEQIDHGKFASISSTCLLLIVGAFGPALKAGSPVTGSVTIFIRCGLFFEASAQFFHPRYSRPEDHLAECQVGGASPWQNDLSLGRYLGLHGRTNLPLCEVFGKRTYLYPRGVSPMGTCDWLTAFRLLFYFKQIG